MEFNLQLVVVAFATPPHRYGRKLGSDLGRAPAAHPFADFVVIHRLRLEVSTPVVPSVPDWCTVVLWHLDDVGYSAGMSLIQCHRMDHEPIYNRSNVAGDHVLKPLLGYVFGIAALIDLHSGDAAFALLHDSLDHGPAGSVRKGGHRFADRCDRLAIFRERLAPFELKVQTFLCPISDQPSQSLLERRTRVSPSGAVRPT